jgi:hypothetical protein
MDPKGKGIVINDKEKESFVNEPKDDKTTDSGSGHRRKEGKKKKTRRIKEIVYYDSDESPLPKRTTTTTIGRRSIRTFHLTILVFHIVRIRICFPFLLANLHTSMGRTTDFGVTKCVSLILSPSKHMGDCREWNEIC